MSRCHHLRWLATWSVILASIVVGAQRGAASSSAARASVRPLRLALVIGNNAPERSNQPRLRYADDDAVAMHELLREAGVHSLAFARLDADSRQIYPQAKLQGTPRWDAISRAVAALHTEVQQAKRAGHPTELLVVYSGHGDVANGEGYVLLEDRHLTRTMLYRDVLGAVGATRNHLVVDACKSYFLVLDRGPGGERQPYGRPFAGGLSDAEKAHTGFVLSTSSERDSHEWERYQAGIFSYEVRSAWRGAADLNGDGAISYAELGAFLSTANAAIANPRFRPSYTVRPPGYPEASPSQVLLEWPSGSATTAVGGSRPRHVYVEDDAGTRVLDANAEPNQRLVLHLPSRRPLYLRENDGTREQVLTAEGSVDLEHTPWQTSAVARRGAAHAAFERLFAEPFGLDRLVAFLGAYERQRTVDLRLTARARADRRRRRTRRWIEGASGLTAISTATAAVALSLAALERSLAGKDASQRERVEINRTIQRINTASFVLYGVALAGAATWLTSRLWPWQSTSQTELVLAPWPESQRAQLGLYVGVARPW